MTSPATLTRNLAPAPPAAVGADLLAQIATELVGSDDLHAVLGQLLAPIVKLAGAQAGAVRVFDEADKRLRMVSQIGLPAAVLAAERSVAQDCGACGRAALGDAPVWADELAHCSAHNDGVYFGTECRRLLALPLHHRGQVLGVYSLFFGAGDEPSTEIMALLKAVGELLGLALNNARLERENLQAALRDERQAMAAEVHDSVAQSLAFVKMRLPLLHDAMLAHDDANALKYHADIRGAVSAAHVQVRELLTAFRVSVDPGGVQHALSELATTFTGRTGIAFSCVDSAGDLRLSSQQQMHTIHVLQEALANVVQHANARHVHVTLDCEAGELLLGVADDGVGITRQATGDAQSHHGIEIMKARAQRLQGVVELQPRAGGGWELRLRYPLRPAPTGQFRHE